MTGFALKMCNLVPSIYMCRQKDLSCKVRHKVYAARYASYK
jgi:hypothetical protein